MNSLPSWLRPRHKPAKKLGDTPAPKKRRTVAVKPQWLPPSRREGDTIILVLPIPSQDVSPNGRAHWSKKNKATQKHKETAHYLTMGLLGSQPGITVTRYSFAYHWPSQRRDDDNAIASGKPYMDGICAALGIDDRTLSFGTITHAKDTTSPRLEITLHP